MAASVGNAIGTVGSFKKMKQAKDMERKGKAGIAGFEWEDLTNPYKNLQVSTHGAEVKQRQLDKGVASAVEASRQGGSRGIAANLDKLQSAISTTTNEIATDLDRQQKAIDIREAQDDITIRDMKERRQAEELAGYGQLMNVGMDMKYQSYADIQATGNAQSQHNMELFETFGGMMGGGGGMGG